jgi:hypothetical protein
MSARLNFCTLFNTAYLSRGLALHASLSRVCASFHLYVFAFDDDCHAYLKGCGLPNLTVISLREFEDEQLLSIKGTRTATEYCWTCTASTILYSIERFGLNHCTYVDADMEFYAEPALLYSEWTDASVLITEHRYTPEYDQSAVSGRYCVQFMAFRNDPRGMRVLRDWRNDCIDWCYARVEDGKFGDQKYLDAWPERYEGVHVLRHPGGGVAPWNVQQYSVRQEDGQVRVRHLPSGADVPLVFYHYHGLRFFEDGRVLLAGELYAFEPSVVSVLYRPYVLRLLACGEQVKSVQSALEPMGVNGRSPKPPLSPWVLVLYYFNDLRRSIRNIDGRLIRWRRQHQHVYELRRWLR